MADTVTERLMPVLQPLEASMTDTSKTAVAAVVERLRIKSSMIMLGEPIAWGSDSAIMDEAASLISALEAERDTWKDLALKKEAFILSKAQDIEAAESRAAALVYDLNAALRTAEAAEAQVAALQAKLEKAAGHIEELSSLLKMLKEHWIDYDHVFSIEVSESDAFVSTLREAGNDHT